MVSWWGGGIVNPCTVLTCCRQWPVECPAEPGMWRPFRCKATRINRGGSSVFSLTANANTISVLKLWQIFMSLFRPLKYNQWQAADQHNGSKLSCTIWGHFLVGPRRSPTDLLLSLWPPASMFRCTHFYELVEVKACCGAVVRVAPDTWTGLWHDFTLCPSTGWEVCSVCWEPCRERHVPEEFWGSVVFFFFLGYYHSQLLLLCYCSTCPDVPCNYLHLLNCCTNLKYLYFTWITLNSSTLL